MKKQDFIIFLVGILSFVLIACNDSDENNKQVEIKGSTGEGVELYLIESYETIKISNNGRSVDNLENDFQGTIDDYLIDPDAIITSKISFQIDESTVITEETPLIPYSDFISYDKNEYIFKLTESAAETIENLEQNEYETAFAIKADDKLMYTGYFWAFYSSQSCDWIMVWPSLIREKGMEVILGTPRYSSTLQEIPDNRNNEEILAIFKRDNKLIE